MRGPGFQYAKDMDGTTKVPALIHIIGKNAVTFTVGNAVRINQAGFVDICDAGEAPAGFCVQVADVNGASIDADSGTLHDYTMNAANQTAVAYMYKVGFIPALPNYLFYNDADGSLTRTMTFQSFDSVSASQIQASSADDSEKTFRLISRDPDGDADASKGLFQVIQSQLGQVSTYPAT